MKRHRILGLLAIVLCASAFIAPDFVQAKAVINSLDFKLTGNPAIDCAILNGEEVAWEFHGDFDVRANYCATESSDDDISTTFGDYGYSGYIKLGDAEEIELGYEDISVVDNDYVFHRDDFVDYVVSFTRIDATTIRADFKLKNLTGEETDFGLAYYTDVELGGNDDAAIAKTEKSFTITQDDARYNPETFGAQFHINLAPTPTTTYIGYYNMARESRWENSKKTYYTAADEIDTGLAYSWQGRIGVDETKNFSATYTTNVIDSFENNFYYLSNEYAEPLGVLDAVDGGMLRLLDTDASTRVGYHREWNTKAAGDGANYESGSVIIANETQPDYYEVEVPNRVTSDIKKNWYGVIQEGSIVITDEVRERYGEMLATIYSNLTLGFAYDEEDVEYYIENDYFNLEEILNLTGKEYKLGRIFGLDDFYKDYEDEEEYQYFEMEESDFPLTVRLKIDEDYLSDKGNLKVVRMLYDYDEDIYKEYELVPSEINWETGELFVNIEELNYDFMYAIVYSEGPRVPDTGVNTKEISLEVAKISLSMAVAAIVFVKVRKTTRR